MQESTRSKILVGVAIAVAGTAATTFIGWIPNPFGPADEETIGSARPTWLVIERVELVQGVALDPVRVTAHVNGMPFVYPSLGGVEWMTVGPTMSPQSFRLPSDLSMAEIRFEMRSRAGKEFRSQVRDPVEIPVDLPYKGTYRLHAFENRTRAVAIKAIIHYSVRGKL